MIKEELPICHSFLFLGPASFRLLSQVKPQAPVREVPFRRNNFGNNVGKNFGKIQK